MDIRRLADRPSRGSLGDIELFLLSMIVAFFIWLGGGWLLAGQLWPPAADPIPPYETVDGADDSGTMLPQALDERVAKLCVLATRPLVGTGSRIPRQLR